jgi:Ni/Fe-hydrogenase 1 B-type cytochrome subunit
MAMETITFYTPYSRGLRLWHWSSFIITCFLLLTILVSKSFLNWVFVNNIIYEGMAREGIHLHPGQTVGTAGLLRERIWSWHTYLGYILSLLFMLRIVLECFQRRDQGMAEKIRMAWVQKRNDNGLARHYLMVRLIYLIFYILLGIMAGTGIWMAFHKQPGYIEIFHSVKEIHENCFLLLLIFIVIHLAGVIRFERKHCSNLISAMVHGGKP